MTPRRDAVDWLVGLLCAPGEAAAARWGGDPPTGDWQRAERYSVVPDGRGAVMLLPHDPRTAARVLAGYGRLRRPLRRLGRHALAAALRARAVRGRQLTVWTAAGADPASSTLVGRLGELLDLPDAVAAVTSGVAGPNRKPMVQLCDPEGRPRAFVKIGWNDATRAQVRAEAEALSRLARRPASGLRAPALLGAGEVGDLEVVATAPLPADVRRYRARTGPPGPEVTQAIAATGDVDEEPLAGSPYWQRLRGRLAALRPAERAPRDPWAHLARAAATVEGRHGADPLPMGAWHGDWSPWNLGWSAGTLHVWDWEHAHVQAPLGADVLHWHFQTSFVLDQRPFEAALAHAERAAASDVAALGAPIGALRATYVLELGLRHQEAVAAGATPNPRMPTDLQPSITNGRAS